MTTTPTSHTTTVAHLRLSPKNTRQKRDPDAVDAMAASILHQGLLQNLFVEPAGNDADVYEVLAGGTRLAAIERLVHEGKLPADFPVRVLVQTNGQAIEASAAENLVRTRLSPAEEFDAFKAMADSGKSRDEIATHFGVARIVVDRSLKLANVAPDLLQVFRDGKMELDQLRSLAITDDHKLQRDIWNSKEPRAQWAANIRKRITRADVDGDSGIAKFVGVGEYEAAGGTLNRDLFSDKVWLTDRQLLESLAMDRLDEFATRLRNDGWSWVETHLSLDYQQLNAYPAGFPDWKYNVKDVPLDAASTARLEAIAKRSDEIEALLYDDEAEPLDANRRRDLYDENEALEAECAEIEALQWKHWPKEVMAQSGCLVYIDREDLTVAIEWARLKPGQKVAGGHVSGTPEPTKASSAHGEAPKTTPKPPPTLSGAMLDRLHLHHRAALRQAMLADRGLAMELLLTQILSDLFTPRTGARKLFDITLDNHHIEDLGGKNVELADVKASPARKAIEDEVASLKKLLPKKAADIQAWLASRSTDELVELFAVVAAVLLDPDKGQAKALAQQVKLDMRRTWAPDADHFLHHVPKALAAQAVAEVHGKAAGEKVDALKKDAAIAEAGKLLANSGWLPKPLRGDDYVLAKPGTAARAAQDAAKATPAKPGKPTPAVTKAPPPPAAKKAPDRKATAKKSPTKKTTAKQGAAKKPAPKKAKAGAK